MQFSRLRLSGFKSFVDPTELIIEPGLTGVVGPNGCGKSNLLEALRWVMGENRAKSLRGSGMDDVIFSGTDRRPARNLAEVTLVLDPENEILTPEFQNSDVLEVTRRIEREAGSAYRMNGRDVRQKDVQLLFADAATGAHSPSLVSQGRIGSLINAKPKDRRAILEEAAGISGLHTRRKEAESRLRGAEGNLVRLQDVVVQMEAQIGSLKRQARQAGRYRTISGDVRQAEASVLYLRWFKASNDVIELERQLRSAEASAAEVAKQVAGLSTEQATIAATLPDLRNRAVEAAAAVQRLTIARESLEAEERRRAEKIVELKARLEQIGVDSAREDEISTDATAGLQRLAGERERLAGAQESEKAAEVEAREKLEISSQAANSAEEDFDALSQQAASARARKESLESDILALDRRLDMVCGEQKRLKDKIDGMGAEDSVIKAFTGAEASVKSGEEALGNAEAAVQGAEESTLLARTSLNDAVSRFQEKEGALKALEAEAKTLALMLADRPDGGTPLADDVRANLGFETAVGAAFGDDIEASEDVGDDRFWHVVDDRAPAPSWPDGVSALSAQTKVPAALTLRLAYMGLLDKGVDGAAIQRKLKPGQKLVSIDGSIWRWDGYVQKAGAKSAVAVRMEQRNRLEGINQKLDQLKADMAAAEKACDTARAAHTAMREAEVAARTARGDADGQLASARRALLEAEQEMNRRASKVNAIRETISRLVSEESEMAERRAGIGAQIAELPAIDGLEEALAKARTEVESLRTTLAGARSSYDGLRREAQARTDRLRAIDSEIGAWQARVKSTKEQLGELSRRKISSEQQLVALESGPYKIEEKRTALIAELESAEAARSSTGDALAVAENNLADKDRALREAQERAALSREGQIRADAAVETAEVRRKDIAALVGERFECPPNKVLEIVGIEDADTLPALTVLESKLDKLKRERERLGAVNLRAEEELSEIEEQMEHLTFERQDLEAAIARLRQAISGLNKEGRERLLSAFDAVNIHFGELFSTLFGGGAAHLALTESDDPLDAGLEIFASPPGKKLQTLSLLSGGEQALTALSLIFAVFMTNPAPICVLDEVDAPLDDANVERFCDLLDGMIKRTNTRFLIVTHNAVSMARMHRLFGVTMAEQGVSTLVSVDLERAEEIGAVA